MSRHQPGGGDFDDAGSDISFDDDGEAPPEDFGSGIEFRNNNNNNSSMTGKNNNTPAAPKSSAMAKIMSSHGINARNPPKDNQGGPNNQGNNQNSSSNNNNNRSNMNSSNQGGNNNNNNNNGTNFFDSSRQGGGGNNNMNQSGMPSTWRGALPQVKSETIQASRESYQLEQALRYHMVMKPKAETASPPEQSHILSHILSFFVHNGLSRSAEALFRSGAVSQPIAAAVRDGPYRDLPRILGSCISATAELFDDDTPWESELLFRFANTGSNDLNNNNNNNNNKSSNAEKSPSLYPTHDFVVLDENSRAQLGTIEFLMTKLVIEQNDVPFAARHRFDVNFTNVFLTTCFAFCTPDAFVAKCLKLFKAMQLHVSLLGEQCVVGGCRRLLHLLAAYVSSNRVDVGRTTLERLLSLSVSILTHAASSPSSGSAEVAQAAQQLLTAIEELERTASTCGAFADLPGASQLRKSVAHAMSTFNVAASSIIATGSTPTLNSFGHSGGGGVGAGGAAGAGSLEPSLRWKSLPYLPFGNQPTDVPRSAFRGDGPVTKIADVPEIEVARQLTLMHYALFQKISPREFASGAWMNSSMAPIAQNLIRFVEQEELVTFWVASSVIMPAEPAERRAAYARLVRIMRLLFDFQNYSLASAFFSGLENSSVKRMSRTVSGSLNDDEQASYDVVKAAMNPFHGSLKAVPQEMRTSCIPMLAPFVGDACRLHDLQQNVVVTSLDMPTRQDAAEALRHQQQQLQQQQQHDDHENNESASLNSRGSRNNINNSNNINALMIKKVPTKVHLVNWSKMIALAKIMLKLASFQSRPYAFDPDSVVQRLLQRLPLMRKDAEKLYQISLEREPSSSTVTAPLTS